MFRAATKTKTTTTTTTTGKTTKTATATTTINGGLAANGSKPTTAHASDAAVVASTSTSTTVVQTPAASRRPRWPALGSVAAPSAGTATLVVLCDSADEWRFERHILRTEVLPDLQGAASAHGFDLEVVDACGDGARLSAGQVDALAALIEQPACVTLCLVGDRYGDGGLPSELRRDEFDAIRTAAIQQSADAHLLDRHFRLDRSRQPDEYRLATGEELDATLQAKLFKLVKKGAEQAFEEGLINQIAPYRQQRFTASVFHQLLQTAAVRHAARCYVVLRKFNGADAAAPCNLAFLEAAADSAKKIATLKNQLAHEMDAKQIASFTFTASDISSFFESRDADKYQTQLASKVTDGVKELLEQAVVASSGGNPPKSPSLVVSSVLHLTLRQARHEAAAHETHAARWLPPKPAARKTLQPRIAAAAAQHSPGCLLLQGGDLAGKSVELCRLYSSFADQDVFRIIRFVGLTASALYAHELWRGVALQLCQLAGRDATDLLPLYRTDDILAWLVSTCDRLERGVVVLIDDLHLLRYGRLMSSPRHGAASLSSSLHLGTRLMVVATCAPSTGAVGTPFAETKTVVLDDFTESEVVDLLKRRVPEDRKLPQEQLGAIRAKIAATTSPDQRLVTGLVLFDEFLLKGNVPTTSAAGLEGRLERIELEFGALLTKLFCRLLCVSLCGLTRLELVDLVYAHSAASTSASSSAAADAQNRRPVDAAQLAAFPVLVVAWLIEAYGSLIQRVTVDGRIVYRWAHPSVAAFVRARYISRTTDLKEAHHALCDLFSDSLSSSNQNGGGDGPKERNDKSKLTNAPLYAPFPQPLQRKPRETVNMRRVRSLWYHLLHTGNMDELKRQALCNYDYLDAVQRACGISHVLSLFEECTQQVLHHDLEVLYEQVLLPALPTVTRDADQLASELIGRLRYTRAENSVFLNTMVEQAMGWVDTYSRKAMIVPLTCWIAPPAMKLVLKFQLPGWRTPHPGSWGTVLAPTHNHQHVLVAGEPTDDVVISMFHIASQTRIATFKGHTARVTSLACSSSGAFFASTSVDKTVRIWSFSTGECSKVLQPHRDRVMCSVLSSDDTFLVTGSADSCAKVIDLASGKVTKTFADHTGSVIALELTSDNQFLITGSGDFVVMMWEIASQRLVVKMSGLMAPVTCLAITSNDAFVAVACEDETLRVFSTVSGTELLELSGHEGKVRALTCARDDCQLFAAAQAKIYCYDIHNGELLDVLEATGTATPVHCLKTTADNFFLLSSSGDWIHVWNVRERVFDAMVDETQVRRADSEGFVTCVALAADERQSACGTHSGIVALWDLEICQCVSTAPLARGVPVTALAFSIDSRLVVAGSAAGLCAVYEATHLQLVRSVQMHASEVLALVCIHTTLDGARVLSCDAEHALSVWSIANDGLGLESQMADETGEGGDEVITTSGCAPPLAAPPTSSMVVCRSSATAKELKIFRVSIEEDALVAVNRVMHNDSIDCVAVTATGRMLVTGSADRSLKVWVLESGFLTQVLAGHEAGVRCCAVSEDERLVVSGDANGVVIVWAVASGESLRHLRPVTVGRPLAAVAVTADASIAFTADASGWVEAWSADRGQLVSSFCSHRSIRSLICSVDANRIVAHAAGCAQLPILCLHNSPAAQKVAGPSMLPAAGGAINDRRNTRQPSLTSSIGSGAGAVGAISADPTTTATTATTTRGRTSDVGLPPPIPGGGGQGGSPLVRTKTTFNKMERQKSRTSLGATTIEIDKITTVGVTQLGNNGGGGGGGQQMTTAAQRSHTCQVL